LSVGEHAWNFETLGKLLGHERFLIASCNDTTIRNSPEGVYMLVGNFPATDYCDTKHLDQASLFVPNCARNVFIACSIGTRGFQPSRVLSFSFE
jgi:hypothetical protein